jgi:hypothetical protein
VGGEGLIMALLAVWVFTPGFVYTIRTPLPMLNHVREGAVKYMSAPITLKAAFFIPV